MKNLKYFALMLGLLIFVSCNNSKVDDELSGYLLMGPYSATFLSTPKLTQEFDSLEGATEDEKLSVYKKLFGHPYTHQINQQAQTILLNDYQITDKSSTEAGIDKLMNNAKNSEYKAFEYAKAVNVANFAYAAGYIPMDQVKTYEQKVLVEARANYKDWDSYFKDFLEGRAIELVDQNPEYQQLFNDIIYELLLAHDESPYKHYSL